MSHERVSTEVASEHRSNFQQIQERFSAPSLHEVMSDADLYEEWKKTIPQQGYGMISLTKVRDNFDARYQSTLREGTLDAFLITTVSQESDTIPEVYVVNAPEIEHLSKSEQTICKNHQPDILVGGEDSILARLRRFRHSLSEHIIPDAYRDEYNRVLTEEERFVEQALGLGNPDFTQKQKTPEGWTKFIDLERTQETGVIHLPLEDIAREVITRASERNPDDNQTVNEAFTALHLSDEEKERHGLDTIPDTATKLTNEQTISLFSLMLERCNLSSWKIKPDTGSAINISASSETINIPKTRELTASQIPYIPPHEFVHVLSGANGLKQGFQKLATGVADYDATQEGTAIMAEMMMGEPFGHERQVQFAARYLIVAMMLKAEKKDDEIVPCYSPQEIFDELTKLGVSEDDAAKDVWRAVRGTSLRHQGMTLEVDHDNKTEQVPAAECNIKDVVYFQGQIEVFNFIKNQLPLLEGQNAKDTLEAVDFNDQFLKRVGIARYKEDHDNRPIGYTEIKNIHDQLRSLGRKTLLDILNALTTPGKIRLDFLSDDSSWNNQLRFKGDDIIPFERILQPVKLLSTPSPLEEVQEDHQS